MNVGEPNKAKGPEECANYKTAASTQAEQRGIRASLQTGLNNLQCSTNFAYIQLVLCRREPFPTKAITPPDSEQTAANTPTATTPSTTQVPAPNTRTSTFRQEYMTTTNLPCLQKCPEPQHCIQSFNFLIILLVIAIIGWSLLAYSVVYIAIHNCKRRANI